jgi:hypothetical protein
MTSTNLPSRKNGVRFPRVSTVCVPRGNTASMAVNAPLAAVLMGLGSSGGACSKRLRAYQAS